MNHPYCTHIGNGLAPAIARRNEDAYDDVDGLEPLDHPTADPAGDDDADRDAVVRRPPLAVVMVGDHHVAGRVHRGVDVDRGAV